MLVILWLNFQIVRLARSPNPWLRKAAPGLGWAFNLAVLFANEVWEGYSWGSLWSGLDFLVSSSLLEISLFRRSQ